MPRYFNLIANRPSIGANRLVAFYLIAGIKR